MKRTRRGRPSIAQMRKNNVRTVTKPTDTELREMLLNRLRDDAAEFLIYASTDDGESEALRIAAKEAIDRYQETLQAVAMLGRQDAMTMEVLADLWDRWDNWQAGREKEGVS
jgi:hypothetical protein